ncbi:hypothetical protein M378DRAFT_171119 [Amanita muscaria Koide BX008]|uniref:Uncharacterized protein n=1 Tax=Amanita muscaria (strain Koide BX008) TaxID=946122 RepID=A0A0C2WMQ6_AMAMK|nr:hypothetical protein M378DRAFT_171119 [Amanita muscaria Koide BX008]
MPMRIRRMFARLCGLRGRWKCVEMYQSPFLCFQIQEQLDIKCADRTDEWGVY